jgi:hypothetical protein
VLLAALSTASLAVFGLTSAIYVQKTREIAELKGEVKSLSGLHKADIDKIREIAIEKVEDHLRVCEMRLAADIRDVKEENDQRHIRQRHDYLKTHHAQILILSIMIDVVKPGVNALDKKAVANLETMKRALGELTDG